VDSVLKLLLLPLKVALCCFEVLSEEFVGEAEKRLVLGIVVRLCQYRDMQLGARGKVIERDEDSQGEDGSPRSAWWLTLT
jgi:hypothetical protein